MHTTTARIALDYPAIDGRPVTEAHARYCRDHGHATHTIDGVDAGSCPRCGTATDVEAFDAILELEAEVKLLGAGLAFAPHTLTDSAYAGRATALTAAKAKLYAAVNALTGEQVRAFGRYRATV